MSNRHSVRCVRAPIAIEPFERIDALFAIEREINGKTPQERVRVRNERSRPLVEELETWLRQQRARVSKSGEIGKAIITASSAGPRSLAFSMMAACACPTTPPSGNCAPSPSDERTGSLQAPMKGDAEPRESIR